MIIRLALIGILAAGLPGSTVRAADLQLALPQPQWLLEPGSPPLTAREGRFSAAEQAMFGPLMPHVNEGNFEQVLIILRERFPDDVARLEGGQAITSDGDASRSRISAAMYHLLGHSFLVLGQYPAAEAAFSSALVSVPDYTRVHESLGLLYLDMERSDEAGKHLARAAELGLYTANLFGTLGYLNQQKRNYWGAVSAYQQALMLQPENAQWQQGLLYSLVQTSQYDSALTLVDGLLQTRYDDADLWLLRAHVGRESGNVDIALVSLETAIRLGDNNAGNLQVAASLHMERGSVARAVELLQRGLQQGMDFSFYNQALGWFAANQAWEAMTTLLASMPDGIDTADPVERSTLLVHQARLSRHNGNDSTASSNLQRAVELDGSNTEALMMLADLFQAANNYNQADLLYQRASADPLHRTNALISLTQLALDQEDFSRALDLLREVVSTNPARFDLIRNIEILENLVRAGNDQ